MRRCPKVRKQISLLVPLGGCEIWRILDWAWLRAYWEWHLPDAEIVIGRDRRSDRHWWRPKPPAFSKACAINDAFRRSHGDIIVILDADTYLHANVVKHCAERIRAMRRAGVRSWFVPYTSLYRLTKGATERLLESSPRHPMHIPNPPPPSDIEGTSGSGLGHKFGALCQIMPREAFLTVGGLDPRMRGWGAEDAAFLRALNTLWCHYTKTPNDILHLWHPKIVMGTDRWPDGQGNAWEIRAWAGQSAPRANDWLGSQYAKATGNPTKMRHLVDEGLHPRKTQ